MKENLGMVGMWGGAMLDGLVVEGLQGICEGD